MKQLLLRIFGLKLAPVKITLVLALLCSSLLSASAQNDCDSYHELLATFKRQGWTIVENKYCNIARGETCTFDHAFSSDLTYFICAFSCDRDVTDVDLYLYESDGTLYKKDITVGSTADFSFNPYTSRTMQVLAKNQASNTPNYNSPISILVLTR